MFKFLRKAEVTLERAGLKAMTNGILSVLLFCGRALRVSLRGMGSTRLISFLRKKKSLVEQVRRKRKARLKGMARLVWLG